MTSFIRQSRAVRHLLARALFAPVLDRLPLGEVNGVFANIRAQVGHALEVDGMVIRVISARKADRQERMVYAERRAL